MLGRKLFPSPTLKSLIIADTWNGSYFHMLHLDNHAGAEVISVPSLKSLIITDTWSGSYFHMLHLDNHAGAEVISVPSLKSLISADTLTGSYFHKIRPDSRTSLFMHGFNRIPNNFRRHLKRQLIQVRRRIRWLMIMFKDRRLL